MIDDEDVPVVGDTERRSEANRKDEKLRVTEAGDEKGPERWRSRSKISAQPTWTTRRNTAYQEQEEWTDVSEGTASPKLGHPVPRSKRQARTKAQKITALPSTFGTLGQRSPRPTTEPKPWIDGPRVCRHEWKRVTAGKDEVVVGEASVDQSPQRMDRAEDSGAGRMAQGDGEGLIPTENKFCECEETGAGIKYFPPPTWQPRGVLASQEIIVFAEDNVLRHRHIFAKNITMTIEDSLGRPQVYHGNATIRLDEPPRTSLFYAPKRERVRTAHRYLFRKNSRNGAFGEPSDDEAKSITWLDLTQSELEAVVGDLERSPMDEGERIRKYTIERMADGKVRVLQETEAEEDESQPPSNGESNQGRKDDKDEGAEERPIEKQETRHPAQKGNDPQPPDRASKGGTQERNSKGNKERSNCETGLGTARNSEAKLDHPGSRTENGLGGNLGIKDKRPTHQENSADPNLLPLKPVKTESSTYGECGCGCSSKSPLKELLQTTRPPSTRDPSPLRIGPLQNLPVSVNVPTEQDILDVEIPLPESRNPGILAAAHLMELRDPTLGPDEASYYAYGATVVGGGQTESPFVRQGQAYVRLYSSRSANVENLPPAPPAPRVREAIEEVFGYQRPLTPLDSNAGPRIISFRNQSVARVSLDLEPSPFGPKDTSIVDEKGESVRIQDAIDGLRMLKGDVDPKKKGNDGEEPMNLETDSDSSWDTNEPTVWCSTALLNLPEPPRKRKPKDSVLNEEIAHSESSHAQEDGDQTKRDLAAAQSTLQPGHPANAPPPIFWKDPYPTPNEDAVGPNANVFRFGSAGEKGQKDNDEEKTKDVHTADEPPITTLDTMNTCPDSPPMLYYPDDIEEDELDQDEEMTTEESSLPETPPPYVPPTSKAAEHEKLLEKIQGNLGYLGGHLDGLSAAGNRVELRRCLGELGLMQIAYDIATEKKDGKESAKGGWGRQVAEALSGRRERAERYLYEKALEDEGLKKKILEAPDHAADQPSPTDWFPEPNPGYVPNNTPDNVEEEHYVPESPDSEPRETPYRPESPEPDALEEVRFRISLLEDRVDASTDDLKIKLKNLEDQVFSDGCMLTELRWRSNEIRKMENKERSNRKKTYRRENQRPTHRYYTRSNATPPKERFIEWKKETTRLNDEIEKLEKKIEAGRAEKEAIEEKLDKVMALAPDLANLTKKLEDRCESQEQVSHFLMHEVAHLTYDVNPQIEGRLKDHTREINALITRYEYLYQIAMGMMYAWNTAATNQNYANNQNHATEANHPSNIINNPRSVAAF